LFEPVCYFSISYTKHIFWHSYTARFLIVIILSFAFVSYSKRYLWAASVNIWYLFSWSETAWNHCVDELDSILNQFSPVHTFTFNFTKIRVNISSSFCLGFPIYFSHQILWIKILYSFLIFPTHRAYHMYYPPQYSWFNYPNSKLHMNSTNYEVLCIIFSDALLLLPTLVHILFSEHDS
jgi:hypothetical protein